MFKTAPPKVNPLKGEKPPLTSAVIKPGVFCSLNEVEILF